MIDRLNINKLEATSDTSWKHFVQVNKAAPAHCFVFSPYYSSLTHSMLVIYSNMHSNVSQTGVFAAWHGRWTHVGGIVTVCTRGCMYGCLCGLWPVGVVYLYTQCNNMERVEFSDYTHEDNMWVNREGIGQPYNQHKVREEDNQPTWCEMWQTIQSL